MKKPFLLIIILILTPTTFAQTAEENGSFRPENEPSKNGPTICGDNICETIEKGVCPQDCQENYSDNPHNQNKTGETEENNKESKNIIENNIEFIAIGFGALVILTSLLIIKTTRKNENTSKKENKINKWIQSQLDDGYDEREIEQFLREQGYSEKQISRAIRKTNQS